MTGSAGVIPSCDDGPPGGAGWFRLIEASAGTGKTYQLVGRLLAAMFQRGPEADPAPVLATTFTRKAAGEILDRLFRRLLEACEDAGARRSLSDQVGRVLTGEDCTRMAVGLARRMDRVRIMTIDSFMSRLASACALDLDIAPGWRIAEEDELAERTSRAIEAAISGGDSEGMRELLAAAARRRFSSAFHAGLSRTVAEMYGAYLGAEMEDGAWERVRPDGPGLDEGALATAVRRLERAPVPMTKKGKPDGRFVRAIDAAVGAVRAGEWERFVTGGLGASYLTDGTYYGVEMPGPLREAIGPLAGHAVDRALGELLERNRATAGLLRRFHERFEAERRESGALSFDDVTRLLIGADVAGRLDDLWYRLDASIDHLLIDEAQDTSLWQFRLLDPLLSELTSGGDRDRGVLIVGDVKQSLYGWREAEPELLGAITGRYPIIRRCGMHTNRRSSQGVLDAVNRVFSGVGQSPALGSSDGGVRAGTRFGAMFVAHMAAGSGGGGLVRVATHPHDEEGRPDVAGGVVGAVGALLEGAGDRRVEIGVLVRANKRIRALVGALRRAGIDASPEGGSPLSDDPAVAALLSVFQVADHPGDSQAVFHVATSPFGGALGWSGVPSSRRVRATASRIRRRLVSRGYGWTVGRLIDRASAGLSPESIDRLEQVVEIAREFDARASLRPAEFVDLVCTRRPSHPEHARVRVMTIHGSKGLEFDAVVLPELDRGWSRGRGGAMMLRSGPLCRPDAVSRRVSGELAMIHPLLREMFAQEEERSVFGELCTLYVAMTRARRALVMLVPSTSAKGRRASASAAALIRGSLCGDLDDDGPGEVIWESVEPGAAWHDRPGTTEDGVAATEIEWRLAPPSGSGLRRAPVVAPSSLEGGGTVDLGARFEPGERGGLDVGTAAHAMLASIGWLDDGAVGADALEAAGRASGADDPAVRTALGIVERAVAGEAAACLRRGWHGPGVLELRREWGFLHEDAGEGGARLVSGVIDRLVLVRGAGGAIERADVIDYKTDRPDERDGGALSERVEHYRPQVRAYCRSVARMFGLAENAVRGVLVFVGIGRIVEV